MTDATCHEVRAQLSPYLDDELDPVASRGIDEHLRTCAACSEAVAAQLRLRADLRGGLDYHRASDTLRARVLRDRRAAAGRPTLAPAVMGVGWRWASVAAAFIVVAAGAWFVGTRSTASVTEALAREALSSHVRSLMANHLTDVASSDQHTVKPWFAGKLDFSPPVTDFATAGYPLVGGRLDYLGGRTVAALVYQRRQHIINVFLWPTTGADRPIAMTSTRQGYHLFSGARLHMTIWVVSDLNAQELADFARRLAQ